jgi:chromosome segregation ATPase
MPRQARLIYRGPDGLEGEVSLVEGTEVSIGRHPACTLTVAQPSVSRRHARFWFEGGAFQVEDLDSSNGTFVNNQRIKKSRLTDGDNVRCGDFLMSFREVAAPPTRTSDQPRLVPNVRPLRRPVAEPDGGTPQIRPTVGPPPREPRPTMMPPSSLREPTPEPRAPEPRLSESRPPEVRRPPPVVEPPPRPAANDEELARLRTELAHWKAQAEGRALLEGGAAAANAAEAELASARVRVEALEAELAAARAAALEAREAQARLERDAGDVHDDAEDKARRIGDLEQANLRAEEQIRTLTDNALKLKEQARSQQSQLEEYRREKVGLEVSLAEARERIDQLVNTNEASGKREAELADAINDLKREVRQKEKAQKEVERQLEVAEYNLRATREENENLRLALGDDDTSRNSLNTTLEHLREVVAEKEAIIEQLQGESKRWELRAQQGEADVAAKFEQRIAGAERGRGEAEAEARRLQGTLRELADHVKALQAELAEADKRADAAEAAAIDVPELRRRLADAEAARDAAIAAQRELQGRVAGLERDVASAETRARDSETQGQTSRDLLNQLNELRRQNRDLLGRVSEQTDRAAALERQLLAAEQKAQDTDAAGGREALAQVNDLRRQNRDLLARVAELTERATQLERSLAAAEQRARDAEASGGRESAQLNDLRRQNRDLKHQVEALEMDLATAKAARANDTAVVAKPAGEYAELRDNAIQLYEAINDVASDLRTNVELMGGYLGDLRPVVEQAVGFAKGGDGSKLRDAVEETDAAVTIDSAEEVLSAAQSASDSFKRSLRSFREVLQRHGYGS